MEPLGRKEAHGSKRAIEAMEAGFSDAPGERKIKINRPRMNTRGLVFVLKRALCLLRLLDLYPIKEYQNRCAKVAC